MAYNDTDIAVRLSKLKCCISEKASTLAKLKKYGSDCSCEEKELLILASYRVIVCGYVTTSSNNLVTELELDHIFSVIARVCDVCFLPKGTSYINNVPVPAVNEVLLNSGSELLLNDGSDMLLNN